MFVSVNPLCGEPPTGEPCAGEPLARFGGRRGRVSNRLFLPLSVKHRFLEYDNGPKAQGFSSRYLQGQKVSYSRSFSLKSARGLNGFDRPPWPTLRGETVRTTSAEGGSSRGSRAPCTRVFHLGPAGSAQPRAAQCRTTSSFVYATRCSTSHYPCGSRQFLAQFPPNARAVIEQLPLNSHPRPSTRRTAHGLALNLRRAATGSPSPRLRSAPRLSFPPPRRNNRARPRPTTTAQTILSRFLPHGTPPHRQPSPLLLSLKT